ncbi:hypothetical protein ACMHYB_08195 [Sorangium sp. So ce1128]
MKKRIINKSIKHRTGRVLMIHDHVGVLMASRAWEDELARAAGPVPGPSESRPRTPTTLIKREMSRQDTKDAKIGFSSWRSWRLGGSKFCVFQAVSTRLPL